ncbi:MAG: M28 family peptidase [Muribaculaceae bacterium]|nr:M28 family peptidase [Muribaculaceae bacterium]
MIYIRRIILPILAALLTLLPAACTANSNASSGTSDPEESQESGNASPFSADSAFAFLKRQVDFGPRVPNTAAHRATAEWLEHKLRQYCDTVIVTRFSPLTFDNVRLDARNIFAQINPEASDRTLLLAHWDTRPWADHDDDPALRRTPVEGANDGASGVAVILELARALHASGFKGGVDILFVDAEDWGDEGDDSSWALGAQHFAQHPPLTAYAPKEAILLDMVGGKGATFTREYFSQQSNPALNQRIWQTAAQSGYGDIFTDRVETAVTDDHVPLIQAGIPAVDIIDYRAGEGFAPTWHTTQDNIDNIDIRTLEAVGNVVFKVLTQ